MTLIALGGFMGQQVDNNGIDNGMFNMMRQMSKGVKDTVDKVNAKKLNPNNSTNGTVSKADPTETQNKSQTAQSQTLNSKNILNQSIYYCDDALIEKLKSCNVEELKAEFGGKGYALADMRLDKDLKDNTVAFFTISTQEANKLTPEQKIRQELQAEIFANIAKMEAETKKTFGNAENPLLVSVRSGARSSMPGMMDTILNVGLNRGVTAKLAESNPEQARFWWDSYARLLEMFGTVVLGIGDKKNNLFHTAFENFKKSQPPVDKDSALTAEQMQTVAALYENIIKQETGKDFPSNPKDQVIMATEAVFKSWNNDRAKLYRAKKGIPNDWGTAVNICEMVFGNKSPLSGTGILFSRNSDTGKKELQGRVLFNGQGEEVVSGQKNDQPFEVMKDHEDARIRAVYQRLTEIAQYLDEKKIDMQDIEYTFEERNGEIKLYLLQTRDAKRSPLAEYVVAKDLVEAGKISKAQGLNRIDASRLSYLKAPQFTKDAIAKAKETGNLLGAGTNASPGAAVGHIVFSAEKAEQLRKEHGDDYGIILVREETNQEDVDGMIVSDGILTSKGSNLSHAAIIAKDFSKCCVVGLSDIKFTKQDHEITGMSLGGKELKEGDVISVNGHNGEVYLGELGREPLKELPEAVKFFLDYADSVEGRMHIRANVEAEFAQEAHDKGARGIGLFRTEHAFKGERLPLVQEILFSGKKPLELKPQLEELKNLQKADFKTVLGINDGHGVTIRLLDAPLHEFFPEKDVAGFKEKYPNADLSHEENPMLGYRSARFLIDNPHIARTQIRAAFEAAAELIKDNGNPKLEIEIPLVMKPAEIGPIREIFNEVKENVQREYGLTDIPAKLGVMIETPVAAAVHGKAFAKEVDFVSFGTNDLNQMSFGLSRNDSDKFLPMYVEKGIFPKHPFNQLDPDIAVLMKKFVDDARSVNKDFEIFICGEHGGDPYSIKILHDIGLTGISMSHNSVEAARLAAAQAALNNPRNPQNSDIMAKKAALVG